MPELHLERDRAESFGSVALSYERYRPDLPAALLDDLATTGDALDIATGTGKLARGLMARGMRVLGVELDARMAEVAAASGVAVEVARFEDWDDAGRRFDLLACGDAWHWIDPVRGLEVVRRVLRPGGVFARSWNVQLLDDAVMARLDVAYRAHAPSLHPQGRLPPGAPAAPPAIGVEETRSYPWQRVVTADAWAGFCNTTSDHQRLPAERRAALLAAIRDALGGPVTVYGEAKVWIARFLHEPR